MRAPWSDAFDAVREVRRGQRPDGTYEVWIVDRPKEALTHLGRFESWCVAWALRLARRDAPVRAADCDFCGGLGVALVEGYHGTEIWHSRTVPCRQQRCDALSREQS